MFSLFRLIYRSVFVNGKPLHQILIGLLLIPVGGAVTWASPFADPDHYYSYFVIAGIVFAIFGLVLLVKGFIGLVSGKSTQTIQGQIMPYTGPSQYPQQPYTLRHTTNHNIPCSNHTLNSNNTLHNSHTVNRNIPSILSSRNTLAL